MLDIAISAMKHVGKKHGFVKSASSSEWIKICSIIRKETGEFWHQLAMAVGFYLYDEKITRECACKLSLTYGQEFANNRMNVVGLRRISIAKSKDGVWHGQGIYPGIDLSQYKTPKEKKEIPIGRYGAAVNSCFLYYLAFIKSYPLGVGEALYDKRMDADTFMWHVNNEYNNLCEEDKEVVDKYLRYYADQPVVVNAPGFVATTDGAVTRDLSSRLLSIKNMKDWTSDDFWDEVTELYKSCVLDSDIKNLKAVLEMKGKSMGILNADDSGRSPVIAVFTEKAVNALASMGIMGKRVVHEQ